MQIHENDGDFLSIQNRFGSNGAESLALCISPYAVANHSVGISARWIENLNQSRHARRDSTHLGTIAGPAGASRTTGGSARIAMEQFPTIAARSQLRVEFPEGLERHGKDLRSRQLEDLIADQK